MPLADLTNALIEQDVEIKASVMMLINGLLSGLNSSNFYLELKTDLNGQLFDERVSEALQLVDRGLQELNMIDRSRSSDDSNSLKSPRRDLLMGVSSLYDHVEMGDIYSNPAESNSYDEVPQSTTTESISLGDLYSKAVGDDHINFNDVYDKDADFDINSYGDNCDSTVVEDVKMSDVYEGSYTSTEAYDSHVPNAEFFEDMKSLNLNGSRHQSKVSDISEASTKHIRHHSDSAASPLLQDKYAVSYVSRQPGGYVEVVSKSKTLCIHPQKGSMVRSAICLPYTDSAHPLSLHVRRQE